MFIMIFSRLHVFFIWIFFHILKADEELTTAYDPIPSKPLNLTVVNATSTTIQLTWLQPEFGRHTILGYHLYFMHENYTNKTDVRNTSPIIDFALHELKPLTDYKVWVKAFSKKHEGEPSDGVNQRTDVSGPGPPRILNITCIPPSSLVVQWARPDIFSAIDFYYIAFRNEDSYMFEKKLIQASKGHLEVSSVINNLTDNKLYEIHVQGAARSILDAKEIIKGEKSESRKVLVRANCDKASKLLLPSTHKQLSSGIIAAIVCILFALLLVTIFAFIIWRLYSRKCFHAAYYYLEGNAPANGGPLIEWDSRSEPDSTIPLDKFSEHVAMLHSDGDIGFTKEYEAIQSAALQDQYSCDNSHHSDNKLKNRYLNILAYDHSRVRLLPIPGQSRWDDYINANFIDGFHRPRAYIGTQGPLPNTFDAFWRMIWEQSVSIIVMITNLVERGRRKCDMYWPKEGTETYGFIEVKLIKEDILAMYTVRTFQISLQKAKKKKNTYSDRLVYQYHYTNWPDHGTPDHPLPVLSFVKKSSAANPVDSGPIVVHCSAGVGRTGTYIVLDAMLKQIRQKNEVNVFGFLRHIRRQRNFLVQTEEQYIFIHDALFEAIVCSEHSLGSDFLEFFTSHNDGATSGGAHWKRLEAHFKMVTSFEAKDYLFVAANKVSNSLKNRSSDFLPVESARVHLTPKPGVEGSDYINASWYLGFKKLREFIITQHPLESTVLDFWQMVWDHNAQTIVLLSTVITGEDLECKIFWPTETETTISGENFKVKYVEEKILDETISRNFAVHSLQDDYELTVRLIESSKPSSELKVVLRLLSVVQESHLSCQNGPIIVVDRFGGTEAATFCCLATLAKQLEYENHADICMYAKLYHNRRPGVWKTMSDYLLLYQALEVLSASSGISVTPSPINFQINGYTNASLSTPNTNLDVTKVTD